MSKWVVLLMTIFHKFAFSNTGCAPMRYDIAFYLVKDNQVTRDHFKAQVDFAKKIVDAFTVGYTQTRFSFHTYSNTPTEVFDFVTKTTKDSVKTALDSAVAAGFGDVETILNTRYVWTTIFTSGQGDRNDVDNYCFMTASAINNNTYDNVIQGYVNQRTVNLQVMDANSGYNSEDTYYSDNAKWKSIANVYEDVTSFQNSKMDDVAQSFINNFPCNYFCGVNYFAYDEPENLNQNHDTSTGKIYLLTDSAWNITCCGVITAWIFYAKQTGTLKIGVFRPTETSNEYRVVGFTTILVPDTVIDTVVTYENRGDERIAIKVEDKIGWYSATENILSHSICDTAQRSDCPQSTRRYTSAGDIETGDIINFNSAETLSDRAYALKFTTANNSEMIIRTNENETELEENSAIGTTAIYMTIVDDDAYEDYTFTVTGNNPSLTYFELNQEKMTLDLRAKLPKGGSEIYTVTIAGEDTCQHSATVTLTVGSYNEPPIINNLPYIYELSEDTKSETKLFQINVTDATNDEICCTMPFTIPNTFNFVFKSITSPNGKEELWLYTIPEPAFEYSDIDTFRVFVCCQDPYGSSYSYLIVRLTEVKQITPYVPPDWFYRAIYISMVPLTIMILMSCFMMILTVFWL